MKILVLPGDGIGPDITKSTLDVLRVADAALSLDLEFETRDIGLATLKTQGTTLPQEVMTRIPEVDGVILGPVSHYEYPTRDKGGINPSGELRVKFELYANLRPCRSRPGPKHPAPPDGPGDRPREHGGLLLRPQHVRRLRRVHAGPGHGVLHPQNHR